MNEQTHIIIDELIVSYWMELETVQNYLAQSTNLDGLRADPIRNSLASDITEELTHAQQLASRIHVLGGIVPGSAGFVARQDSLQPTGVLTDVVAVIKGVIDAEEGAIEQYRKLIGLCRDHDDPVTEDLCITLLADEEKHRREFVGFLSEYEVTA